MFSFSGFFNSIILLGTLQGFIVCCLLFYSKKNKLPDRLLAKLIFLMSLASLNLYLNEIGVTNLNGLTATLSALIPMVIVMPMGPLVYFYIRSSLDPEFKMSKKHRLYFLPIIIDLVPSLTVLIFFAGVYMGMIKPIAAPWGIFIDDYNVYADIPRWISITFYLWLAANYLSDLKRKNNITNGRIAGFKWMQQFIRIFLVFQFIWLLYLVPYVIPRYTNLMLDTFKWYPVYIPLAIMIYWLGIKGYLVSHLQTVPAKKNGTSPSSSTSVNIDEIVLLLRKSMEEDKIYLNPNLNLTMVALHTQIAQKTISAVLNQHLQKSFNEFVNYYRVEAIKTKLQQAETNNLTIAGVAMECGFNSQATFQRTFKELTGMSPSEFRKQVPERPDHLSF
ncbi:helix-turn-helix transcriptional regulator [Terrimonas alba]|uniref:helix-turn-helix transcriptional regulator n=1 Tax=Terrimonas alba TaxID=3349636 RepID=UPI0035F33C3B